MGGMACAQARKKKASLNKKMKSVMMIGVYKEPKSSRGGTRKNRPGQGRG